MAKKTATKTAPPPKPSAKKPEPVKQPEPAPVPVDPAVLENQTHKAAVEKLAEQAMEVSYEISGLPRSRRVSDAAKTKMIATVNATKSGISMSKRLYSSRHPLLVEFNAARRRLDKWRDGFVIVKAAEQSTDEEGTEKIVAGVRLIMAKDIPEFEQGFKIRVDEYYAAAAQLQRYMRQTYFDGKKEWPSVLDAIAAELGTEFNKADYPDDITDEIRVVMPTYTDYAVSIKLPAEIRKRQEKRIEQALSGTLETATSSIADTLTKVFTTFAAQLVNRTRVFPAKDDPLFGKYHGAEVVTISRPHDDDASIPATQMILTLRYKVEEEGKEKSVTETLTTMHEKDYEETFKPQTTDERKKLTKSVLDNIVDQMQTVVKVKEMLGPYGDKLGGTIEKLQTIFHSAGKSTESVLNEAKNSVTFRNRLSEAINGAVVELAETVETVRKVRRRINPALIGGTQD